MKVIKIICILFLSLVIVNGSEESESLRKILNKSIAPGELRKDWLDENLKTWSGINTMDGVVALYDIWTSETNGFELLACTHIQSRLQVPPEQIAGFLMDRAKNYHADTYMMMRYLDMLELYADDPRVTKYYASLLSDNRPLNRNLYPVEGGHTIRVCDVALKNLIIWLKKKNFLKGDVTLGDGPTPDIVWDPLHAVDFEHNIIAIRPYLVKAGVIEDSNQSRLNDPDDLQPTIVLDANEAVTEKSKAPESTIKSTPNQQTPSSATWSIIVVLTVAALGFLWLVLKRRS